MSEKFYSLVTKIGQAQFANALALDQKVAFGTFAVGDGGGSVYDPSENQTDLKHEVWSGKITSLTIGENNPNELVVETYIPSNKGGFTIREFGIKDKDGNLLVIGKHPETYKPIAADGTAKDITLRIILAISNAQEVILKIDPSVQVATRQDLEKVKADFDVTKGSLASKKDFEDFKTSFEEDKKVLASKDDLDTHKKDTSLHTTKEDKAKLKAIPANPKYTDTTYTFDKGLSLAGGKVSAKLGDGLVFDTTGNIKASDTIARKSDVDGIKTNLSTDIGTKADKTDLNNYVAKVEGKGLSTNDFDNTYKSNIDKNLRDEAEVMRLALKVARRDALFKSNELYKDLNNYYGTSISSSIRTLDQFQKSPTAMAQLLNNPTAKREMESDLAYSRAIFEACMPYFKVNNSLDNLDYLRQYLKDDFKAKAIFSSPKCVKYIIDDDMLLKVATENSQLTYIFSGACDSIKSRNCKHEGGNKFYTKDGILLLGIKTYSDTYISSIISGGPTDRNGNAVKLDEDKIKYLGVYEDEQKKSNSLWKIKLDHVFDDESYYNETSMFNIVNRYGYVKAEGFKDGTISKNCRIVYLDLAQLNQDLARGL